MDKGLTGIAEATNIEIVDSSAENSFLILNVRTDAHEQTRIRIGLEQAKNLAHALSFSLRPSALASTKPNPFGFVILSPRTVDLLVDPARDLVALVLDTGSELKCLIPLTGELAQRFGEIGHAASRCLQHSARALGTVN